MNSPTLDLLEKTLDEAHALKAELADLRRYVAWLHEAASDVLEPKAWPEEDGSDEAMRDKLRAALVARPPT